MYLSKQSKQSLVVRKVQMFGVEVMQFGYVRLIHLPFLIIQLIQVWVSDTESQREGARLCLWLLFEETAEMFTAAEP